MNFKNYRKMLTNIFLYSLSCLGESTCNSIVRTHGAVEALVSLVTVEAQSYGPKACILMRVVETVPGATALQQAQAQATQQQLQSLRPVQAQPQQPQGQPQAAASGQNVVRTQLVQIAKPGGSTVQLPQQPLPMTSAAATSTPTTSGIQPQRRILPQGTPVQGAVSATTGQQQFKIVTATTANGQPQQLIIAGGQIALNKGLVIATTAASATPSATQQPIRSQLVQAAPSPTPPAAASTTTVTTLQPQQVQPQGTFNRFLPIFIDFDFS